MAYLIDNPIILLFILIGIGVTVVASTKYLEEYGLNRQLRLKQRSMRIKGEVVRSKKSLLGALALAPTFLFVLGIFVAANIGSEDIGQFITVRSSDDILQIFENYQEQTQTYSNGWFRNDVLFATDDSVGSPEMEFDGDAQTDDQGSGSDDYSGPNNQVDGVDELDIVVTDGKYIYTMHGAAIQITLAYTVENGIDNFGLFDEITYEQDFDSCESKALYPVGMYAYNDYDVEGDGRLIVITSEYNNYNYNCLEDGEYVDWYERNNSNNVKVMVYDSENDFELLEEYSLNGYYTGTRRIGDELYVITNKYLPFYEEDINIDEYLPYYEVNGIKTTTRYEDIVYVNGTSPNTFTSFFGINLKTTKVDMEVVLGDNGYNLYVSDENMYLVGSVYYWFDATSDDDAIYQHRTAIMKVSIDNAEVEFDAIGYIEGYTLNQFSMDEHDDHLRITTTSGWWGEDINNRLYVLDEDLEVVSVLENLGHVGETIKSTRFSGDYGYLVTFEQTDPFYVIDLSDPLNPEVVGELEIPGFSSYLQPLNNDYMLGIGFTADNEGRIDGMKLDIYDISDKTVDPTVFDSVEFKYADFGWVWSSVTYNHKDLLIDLGKGIIAFPFSSHDYSEEEGYTYKSGIMMYDLDLVNGFSDTYSFIEHEENSDEYVNVYKAQFISDYLYTISNKYVAVSLIDNPTVILKTQNVLRQENYYYWGFWGMEDDVMID